MKKKDMIMAVLAGLAASSLTGLAVTGRQTGWGPFSFLFQGFEGEVRAIEKRDPPEIRKGEILFYGASNFRLWKEMEEDLSEFGVMNHGFGGSTDRLLVRYTGRLLYPYEPRIVVFQTGSNDYTELTGSDEDKVRRCMEAKREMFSLFHEHLPRARFIVMSGLHLPGRSRYRAVTEEINRQLYALCHERDYMTFVDASDMTMEDGRYREDLFRPDRIHLNRQGQVLWMEKYIRPALKKAQEDAEICGKE